MIQRSVNINYIASNVIRPGFKRLDSETQSKFTKMFTSTTAKFLLDRFKERLQNVTIEYDKEVTVTGSSQSPVFDVLVYIFEDNNPDKSPMQVTFEINYDKDTDQLLVRDIQILGLAYSEHMHKKFRHFRKNVSKLIRKLKKDLDNESFPLCYEE